MEPREDRQQGPWIYLSLPRTRFSLSFKILSETAELVETLLVDLVRCCKVSKLLCPGWQLEIAQLNSSWLLVELTSKFSSEEFSEWQWPHLNSSGRSKLPLYWHNVPLSEYQKGRIWTNQTFTLIKMQHLNCQTASNGFSFCALKSTWMVIKLRNFRVWTLKTGKVVFVLRQTKARKEERKRERERERGKLFPLRIGAAV